MRGLVWCAGPDQVRSDQASSGQVKTGQVRSPDFGT